MCDNPDDTVELNYDNTDTFDISPIDDSDPMLAGSEQCKKIRRKTRRFSLIPRFPPQKFTLMQFSFLIKDASKVLVSYIQAAPGGYTISENEVEYQSS